MADGVLFLLCLIIMLIGVVGTIVPVLPGLALVWFGALMYFIGDGFDGIDIGFFTAITLLALAGTVLSIVVPGQRSRAAGAAWTSIALGFVGAVVGAFVLPVLGVVLGGIAGVYAGERLRNTGHPAAWEATLATIKGMGWAFVFQFTASVAILATFVIWGIATG